MLSPVTGEAWEQAWKVAGSVVFTDRMQRAMNAGAQLTSFFLFSPGPQPVRWSCPCLRVESFRLG